LRVCEDVVIEKSLNYIGYKIIRMTNRNKDKTTKKHETKTKRRSELSREFGMGYKDGPQREYSPEKEKRGKDGLDNGGMAMPIRR